MKILIYNYKKYNINYVIKKSIPGPKKHGIQYLINAKLRIGGHVKMINLKLPLILTLRLIYYDILTTNSNNTENIFYRDSPIKETKE
jgi:hypothetical protein